MDTTPLPIVLVSHSLTDGIYISVCNALFIVGQRYIATKVYVDPFDVASDTGYLHVLQESAGYAYATLVAQHGKEI